MNPEKVIANTVDVLLAYEIFERLRLVKNYKATHRENIQQDLSLDGNQQLSYDWRFNLPSDAPITDKSGSLFLLFGGEDVMNRGGRLDVRVKMMELLQSFLQTYVTQFQFVQRSAKYKDGWTEVQLDPPTGSREFPNLEHVMCYLRMLDEKLELKYRCKTRLSKKGESMKMRKYLEVSQTLTARIIPDKRLPKQITLREMIEIAVRRSLPWCSKLDFRSVLFLKPTIIGPKSQHF